VNLLIGKSGGAGRRRGIGEIAFFDLVLLGSRHSLFIRDPPPIGFWKIRLLKSALFDDSGQGQQNIRGRLARASSDFR
jgi:hypothetical protein